MNNENIRGEKMRLRRELTDKSFAEKVAILIRLQRIAGELARASGRNARTVWGE